MEWVFGPIVLLASALVAGQWLCLLVNLLHYRRGGVPAAAKPLLPMTLLKPVKGLDDGLRENFEAIIDADPDGVLQVLIAVEGDDDPAYPALKAFKDAHPGREIELVLTGPSGPRMGKIHNMIEALPRAKHPRVVFSDADIRASAALVAETSQAFRTGAEAVFAAPYHAVVPGLGGVFYQIAFNHGFTLPLALMHKLGVLPPAAGAWMGYTREALERAGGLKPHAQAIADDYAVSRAVLAAGARPALLRETVRVSETGTGVTEAFEHLSKWMSIIRWSLPEAYFLVPFFNPALLALVLALLGGGWGLFAAALLTRAAVGLIQDLKVGGAAMPWYGYPILAVSDLGAPPLWLRGLRREILWRGKRYRLHAGGRAEVLNWPKSGESAKVAAK